MQEVSSMLVLLASLATVNLPSCSAVQIIMSTWADDFTTAVERGVVELHRGGSSLDAVEVACRACEELQCDGTVGFGGSPDEHGETTLDALIMDGTRMDIGAVAGLRRVKNVIGVARKVLENTKHTLLVGDQATQFAKSMGFLEENLTTLESKEKWKAWKARQCQPNFWTNVKPDPQTSCGPYKPKTCSDELDGFCRRDDLVSNLNIDEHNHDTIGVVAIDSNGDIAAATSTNGAIHKIPGRVGDSPIPGAGAYAVTGVGAAAATGDGDVMMRFLPSYLVVELLRSGIPIESALTTAIKRIIAQYPQFSGAVIGVDHEGNYGAACHGLKNGFPYSIGKVGEKVLVKTVTCIDAPAKP